MGIFDKFQHMARPPIYVQYSAINEENTTKYSEASVYFSSEITTLNNYSENS